MARPQTVSQSTETEDTDQQPGSGYQGFPPSAVADKPGHEREFTLDRIERRLGSIL